MSLLSSFPQPISTAPRWPALLLAASLLLAALASPPARSEPVLAHYDIAKTNLSDALIEFSRQTKRAILFTATLDETQKAPVLRGDYSVGEALDILLGDSGLRYRLVEDHLILVLGPAIDNTAAPTKAATADNSGALPPDLEYLLVTGRVVTGSHIPRNSYEVSMPIDVLTRDDLALRGTPTVAEKLKFLPAVSGNSTSTAVTNGGDGTATVTLRGLPANNTLVLINGRRVAADGLKGDAVDLNAIAPAAIHRIEVLKDGASAVYGADAIAGVVNIVMDNDFEGLQIEQFYGQSSSGDLETATTNLLWGTHFERGSAMLALTHYDQNDIMSADREVSARADGRSWGGEDLRSSATPDARITLPDGSVVIPTGNGFRAAGADDLYDFAQVTTAWTPHTHDSLYSALQFDLREDISGFLELGLDRNEAEYQLAPTPVFTAFETLPVSIAADQLYNDFGVQLDDVRRRMVELPTRRQRNESLARRAVLGLTGVRERWRWDTAYSWSYSRAEETQFNLLDNERLALALGTPAGCANECVALNLLGPAGSISADQLAWLRTDASVDGYSKLQSWTANTAGPLLQLPAGELSLAAGAEYREEATRKTPEQDTITLGGANFIGSGGSRHVSELYVESAIPLLRQQAWVHSLELELAARYSHYSDFGDTTNPRVGLLWRPIETLLLRGTWSTGFRAPSLNELYKVAQESQSFLFDPCSDAANVGVLPGCAQQSDPTRNQYLTLFGGNPQLQPEQASNSHLGVVWTPRGGDGPSASLDLFRIEQEDKIDTNAQLMIDANASLGLFPDRVLRDAQGEIQRIIATNINSGTSEIEGADISLFYPFAPRPAGRFALAFNAAHVFSFKTQPAPQLPARDIAGTFVDEASDGLGALPKWKGNLGLQWRRHRWAGNYTLHYIDALEETVPADGRQRHIDSWASHDIQIGYQFSSRPDTRLRVGIDNLFDEAPPRIASAFNNNTDPRTYEIKGRFWYTQLSLAF